jgi:GNAT superfamily N-acetyltransferase
MTRRWATQVQWRVLTHAPSRGQGIGDVAVRQVLAWARDKFPGSHVVLSVKTDNDHARTLYERHGFVDAGASLDDPDERLMLL